MSQMLKKLNEAISSILPTDTCSSIKQNIESILRSHLEDMNFVTREQLDIQRKVLNRSRERILVLESKLKEFNRFISSD